jgi:hypothetical protein
MYSFRCSVAAFRTVGMISALLTKEAEWRPHRISERPMRRRTRRILSRSKVWGKFTGFWQPNSSQETWCRRARGK